MDSPDYSLSVSFDVDIEEVVEAVADHPDLDIQDFVDSLFARLDGFSRDDLVEHINERWAR